MESPESFMMHNDHLIPPLSFEFPCAHRKNQRGQIPCFQWSWSAHLWRFIIQTRTQKLSDISHRNSFLYEKTQRIHLLSLLKILIKIHSVFVPFLFDLSIQRLLILVSGESIDQSHSANLRSLPIQRLSLSLGKIY